MQTVIDIINLNRLANKDLAQPVPINEPPVPNAEYLQYNGVDKTFYSPFGMPMVQPVRLKNADEPDGAYWTLPIEPLITIGGSNTVIRRKVAKRGHDKLVLRGTIKERWMEEDFKITIEGMFTNPSMDVSFSSADMQRLYNLCTSGKCISILSPGLLDAFGIKTMVIENFEFPHTKGVENQGYTITAYSDDDWYLLYKLKSSVSVSGTT